MAHILSDWFGSPSAIVYWSYIGIIEKNVETTIFIGVM